MALRGIVGFREEVRESLLLNQMTAVRVTIFQNPKSEMHRRFRRWNTQRLPNHTLLITNKEILAHRVKCMSHQSCRLQGINFPLS